jgi:hypothetical protein
MDINVKNCIHLVQQCSPSPWAWLSLLRCVRVRRCSICNSLQRNTSPLTYKWAKAPINRLSNQLSNQNQSHVKSMNQSTQPPTLFLRDTCLHWLISRSWPALIYIDRCFLPVCLVLYPEDGDNRFLRNVGNPANIHKAAALKNRSTKCVHVCMHFFLLSYLSAH